MSKDSHADALDMAIVEHLAQPLSDAIDSHTPTTGLRVARVLLWVGAGLCTAGVFTGAVVASRADIVHYDDIIYASWIAAQFLLAAVYAYYGVNLSRVIGDYARESAVRRERSEDGVLRLVVLVSLVVAVGELIACVQEEESAWLPMVALFTVAHLAGVAGLFLSVSRSGGRRSLSSWARVAG